MAFSRMTKNVKNVSMLPDAVQGQSNELKNTFDQAGVDLKDALNLLIDELGANTSAENLGALKDNIAITVQEYLDFINNNKQNSEEGKGLSTEDFTTDEKNKLAEIEEGANNFVPREATDTTLGEIILGNTLKWENGRVESIGNEAPDLQSRARLDVIEPKVDSLEDKVGDIDLILDSINGEEV